MSLVLKLVGFVLFFQLHTALALNLPMPEVEELPNGLKVVWFVKDSLPLIDLSVFVKAGYRDDSEGKSGTLELLSALFERGPAKKESGPSSLPMSKTGESFGAIRTVIPDDDSVSIGYHGLAQDAYELLELLGQEVLQSHFSIQQVKQAHSYISDRRSQVLSSSEGLAQIAWQRSVFASTNYARGGFASMKEFSHVGREDIIQFYNKFFTPKNSFLLVAGRVDRPSFKKKILSIFGQWQGSEPQHFMKIYRDARLHRKREKILLVDRRGENQVQIRLGMRAPVIRSSNQTSLLVGNAILGEHFNRLGLAYSVQSILGFKKDDTDWMISSLAPSEGVGSLISGILEVLKTIKKGAFTEEEVEGAKVYLQGGFPLTVSSLNLVASRWLSMTLFGLKEDYLSGYIDRMGQVNSKQVQEVLFKTIDLDRIVVVLVGDAMKITPSLRKAGLGSIKKVSASDLQ